MHYMSHAVLEPRTQLAAGAQQVRSIKVSCALIFILTVLCKCPYAPMLIQVLTYTSYGPNSQSISEPGVSSCRSRTAIGTTAFASKVSASAHVGGVSVQTPHASGHASSAVAPSRHWCQRALKKLRRKADGSGKGMLRGAFDHAFEYA